jgi:hypothetical protein
MCWVCRYVSKFSDLSNILATPAESRRFLAFAEVFKDSKKQWLENA